MEGLSFKDPLEALLAGPGTGTTGTQFEGISRVPPNSEIQALSEQLSRVEKKMEEGFATLMTVGSAKPAAVGGYIRRRRTARARKSRKHRGKK